MTKVGDTRICTALQQPLSQEMRNDPQYSPLIGPHDTMLASDWWKTSSCQHYPQSRYINNILIGISHEKYEEEQCQKTV